MPRLGIPHPHQSHVRQFCNASVIDLDGHDIVLTVGNGQWLTEVALNNEVAEQKTGAAALDNLSEIFHSLLYIGPLALGFEVQELSDDIKDVLATLLRRYKLLYAVGKEDDANLIVVLYGAEGQCGCNLCNHITLGLYGGSEVKTSADVHEQHHGQFTFLFENLDIRFVESGGNVPFYVADIVAVLIFTHFAEGHTTPLEGRVVLSGKDVRGETAGLDFYLADALKDFRCFHDCMFYDFREPR